LNDSRSDVEVNLDNPGDFTGRFIFILLHKFNRKALDREILMKGTTEAAIAALIAIIVGIMVLAVLWIGLGRIVSKVSELAEMVAKAILCTICKVIGPLGVLFCWGC